MGIVKRAADLVYTFRFLKLLVTSFDKTAAFKLGLIDEKGKRLKKPKTSEEKNAYTPFHRLVFNVKKIIPAGKVGSYASALYLIKEDGQLSDKSIEKIMEELGLNSEEFMLTENKWFVCEDRMLSPGIYRLQDDKMLSSSYEDIVKAKDKVRIQEKTYPIGDVYGIDIYEATHMNTNQKIHISSMELIK
tara:strand:+ start:195 stop:761 length:567 start_codon:yes stop_codon:yes gene_type:complete